MTPSLSSVVKAAEFFSRPLAEARVSTLVVVTTVFCLAIGLNWLPVPEFLTIPMAVITIIAMLGLLATVSRLISIGIHRLIDSRQAKRAAEREAEAEAARLAEQEALLPTLIADMSPLHLHITEALLIEASEGGYLTVDFFAPFSGNNHHEMGLMEYLVAQGLATRTPHPSYRHGIFRPTEKLQDLYKEHLITEGHIPPD
ncbi:hypothetical protein [Cobetia sp. 1AS1]|uniref:hypothetical protein n=1 Tax=Cobetia sp. 1AS1 TaxID=3040016 RepID=UPI002448AB73|nr:hypothetical protein [Cobetia sp. 1AS1]MDH2296042.1 hypothetical protein [Cobetia sp. 1AS1]